MAKYSGKPGKKTGTPLFVWVIVAVGVLAILGVGSFFGYRILRGPTGTEALPTAQEMPSLPRPDLPAGPALPESAEMPPLPQGPALPQVEPSEPPQLPEGPALPEAEPAPEPEPEPAGPSGVVYWAGTVHPFQSHIVQPQAGYQYVTALYRVVNKSTATVHVDHHLVALQYQGQTYYPYVWASGMDAMANRRFLSPVDLAPNSMTEGYVAFQIPLGASGVEPAFSPQGLPAEIEVRRVKMEELPSLAGPAPSRPVR